MVNMNEKKDNIRDIICNPIFVLLYLFFIACLFLHFGDFFSTLYLKLVLTLVLFVLISAIPAFVLKPNPNFNKPINGQFSDYIQFIDEILKENNIKCKIVIFDDEKRNLYAKDSIIYLPKGFVEYWFKLVPLNDKDGKIKILSLLGHEVTHLRQQKYFCLEYIIRLLGYIIPIIFLLFLVFIKPSYCLKDLSIFFVWLILLIIWLIPFYVNRELEFKADEGGVEIANNNTGIILFLETVDDSVKNGYKLKDIILEFFNPYPHSIKRIEKIEKLKL